MHELLRHFNLCPPAGPAQDVYTLHFDGQPSVHIVHRVKEGQVDLMCQAGKFDKQKNAASLMELLELNRPGHMPDAVLTLNRGSGAVISYARQQLATLDLKRLTQLLECVRKKSQAAARCLNTSPSRNVPAGSAALSRNVRLLNKEAR